MENGETREAEFPDGGVMAHGVWTHRVENIGDNDIHAVIFETKLIRSDSNHRLAGPTLGGRRIGLPAFSAGVTDAKLARTTRMPSMKRLLRTTFLLPAILVFVLAACAGAEPQARTIDITIDGPDVQPAAIEVNQNDTITLNLTSEHPILFHLHGYDIARQINPGETAVLEFEADATGRFTLGLHGELPKMDDMSEIDDMSEGDHEDEAHAADDGTVHEIDGWLQVQPR